MQLGEGELYLEAGEPSEPVEEDDVANTERSADRLWLDPKTRRLQIDAKGAAIEIGL